MTHRIVYGLLDTSSRVDDRSLANRWRELTITWSRYSYRGAIIERAAINEILDEALGDHYDYCFIQAYGHMIRERRSTDHWKGGDFRTALVDWAKEHDFFVAGHIRTAENGWHGVALRCLVVNLRRYEQLGKPPFGEPSSVSMELPQAVPSIVEQRTSVLSHTAGTVRVTPRLPGWKFIAASLSHRIPVLSLSESLRAQTLYLGSENPTGATTFARYLGNNIENYESTAGRDGLSRDQTTMLDSVKEQAQSAQRGVFLINIEPYTDVESPPDGWRGVVSTLYSVASGFKPNKILQTHGLGDDTRIVFFDYSSQALAVRREFVRQWDGDDFPDFVEYLFKRFPSPSTFYQPWSDISPDELDRSDLKDVWIRECERFGGHRAFVEHWNVYRRLPHEYVCCNILTGPEALLDRVRPEPNAVNWFSNAPFTVNMNWRLTLGLRKHLYERWVENLAALNPDMLLYGSNYNNISVNCIKASEYWDHYRANGDDPLYPRSLSPHDIRT